MTSTEDQQGQEQEPRNAAHTRHNINYPFHTRQTRESFKAFLAALPISSGEAFAAMSLIDEVPA